MKVHETAPTGCKMEKCEGKHYAKGFCLKHYTRFQRHGDPDAILPRGNNRPCRVPDKEIIEAYNRLGSVYKVGKLLGMHGGYVHIRLKRLGIPMNGHGEPWTEHDDEILRAKYLFYRDLGKLKFLAEKMGRTRHFICKKAKELNFTDISHDKKYISVWKYMEKDEAELIFEKFKKSKFGLGQFLKRYGLAESGFRNTMIKFFPDAWEHVIEAKAPKSSPYRLGRQVEYNVRDDFKKNGFIVMRSPASKGPIDLVAIAKGIVVFIQCKRNMAMGVDEWNKFYKLALSVDAIPILAGRPTGYGLKYCKITGLKDGSKRIQPKQDFTVDDIIGLRENHGY